jgi:predicted AAA+ superfamily ATPase
LVSDKSLSFGHEAAGSRERSLVLSLRLLGLSQGEKQKREGGTLPFLPTATWIRQARLRAAPPTSLGLYPDLWRGALPGFVTDACTSRDKFFEGYVEAFIERDIRANRVVDTDAFRRFLHVVAQYTAKAVNYAEMARAVGVNLKTARAWIDILEDFGWVYRLYPYDGIPAAQMVKTPKLYFLDTGLCAYLAGFKTGEDLETGPMNATIVETHMLLEVLKSYWNVGHSPDFRFYRDRSQKEIDLIIPANGTIYPIEFRKTMVPRLSATKNFAALQPLQYAVKDGGILALHHTDMALSETVRAIPISYL